ncbi:hypothetical protein EC991_008127 [Linnemannia zychae]|nr:hypothetical protein EC991_008127 [Linnemannia zychae]
MVFKQLTRVELHTEGLSEETDELWYIHALNDFESLRKQTPTYDRSGEWRTKYQTMKKEEEEKYARISARLRQNYSQYDQEKQERRVILDPTLRPKKTLRQPGSSSWSTPTPPKKKSLFEKARMEARKINPVVYLAPAKVSVTPHNRAGHGSNSSSTGGSMSPTSPTRSAVPPKPTASSPNGAIMDFFKQINPAHSQQATSSHHGLNKGGSRSPTSPVQPPSKTMQMLREPIAQATATTNPSISRSGDRLENSSNKTLARGTGDTMKQVKVDGDYSWLENDDDEDYSDVEMEYEQSTSRKQDYNERQWHHKRSCSGGHLQEGSPPAKKPMDQAQSSLDETSRQFL